MNPEEDRKREIFAGYSPPTSLRELFLRGTDWRNSGGDFEASTATSNKAGGGVRPEAAVRGAAVAAMSLCREGVPGGWVGGEKVALLLSV